MLGLMTTKRHLEAVANLETDIAGYRDAYNLKHNALMEANRQMNDLRNNLRIALRDRDDLRPDALKYRKTLARRKELHANAKADRMKEGVS